ncbi:hypothetical protein TPA0907_03100 [Micromonospora humidisoli]|nr:hypothetical protein TPA0907_03100 [Micromonospora sp. AKA109]
MAVTHRPSERPPSGPPLRVAMLVPPWLSVPPPGYGGLEQVVHGLVDALVGHGHRVTLFGAGRQHGTTADFVSTIDELQYDRLGESLPELAHLARINRLVSAADFDVIHDHTTIGPLVAGRRAVPTVATVHGNPVGEYGRCSATPTTGWAWWPSRTPNGGPTPTLPWVGTVHNALDSRDVRSSGRPAVVRCSGWPGSARTGPDTAIRA